METPPQNYGNPFSRAINIDHLKEIQRDLRRRDKYDSIMRQLHTLRRIELLEESKQRRFRERRDIFKRNHTDLRNTDHGSPLAQPLDGSLAVATTSTASEPLQGKTDTLLKPMDPVYDGHLVQLFEVKNIISTKFKARGADFRCVVKPIAFSADFETVLGNLYDIFSEIISHFFDPLPDHFKGRFVVNSPHMSYGLSCKYLPIREISPELLFSEMFRILSSDAMANFRLDEDLRIHLIHVELPGGSGPTLNPIYNDPGCHNLNKKSCKIICRSANDYLCLSRAIIVSKGLADYPDNENLYRKKYLKLSDDLQIFEQQKDLHRKAGVPIQERLYTLNDVRKFQQVLSPEYRIFVFDSELGRIRCLYAGDETVHCKHIYLYLFRFHFHSVTCIQKFYPEKQKFCTTCLESYNSRTYSLKHLVCGKVCANCLHPNCDQLGARLVGRSLYSKKCDQCSRDWYSPECFSNHITIAPQRKSTACSLFRRCKDCGKIVESYKLNQQLHKCFMTFCKVCKEHYEEVSSDHICYLSPLPDTLGLVLDHSGSLEEQLEQEELFFTDKVIEKCKYPHLYFDVETYQPPGQKQQPILVVAQNEAGEEMYWYGQDCIDKFCKWLFTKEHKNSLVLSHNGSKFDNFYILEYCHRNSLVPDVLFAGSAILYMKVKPWSIVFKDHCAFIPRPLAALPKELGLDIDQKGFFPLFMSPPKPGDLEKYTAMPDKSLYGYQTMTEERANEFLSWYEKEVTKGTRFNYFRSLLEYCSLDTKILRLSATVLRRHYIAMTHTDPFVSCMTLAGLSLTVYRRMFLKKNQIINLPHDGLKTPKRFNPESIVYFEYLMKKDPNLHILHARNASNKREAVVAGYHVDGLGTYKSKQYGTKRHRMAVVYEFVECKIHSCKKHCDPLQYNSLCQMLNKDNYLKFTNRIKTIEAQGYMVKVIWSCELKEQRLNDQEFDQELKDIASDCVFRLEPGQLLYGGRVEAWHMHMRATSSHVIRHYDVSSLYPAIQYCFGDYYYPIGPPEIVLNPLTTEFPHFWGFLQVKILPPRGLFLAVLPWRDELDSNKLYYPLCKLCARTKLNSDCPHSAEERSWVASYSHYELQLALTKGYKILKIYEVYHWPQDRRTKELFRGYIDMFYKVKLCSSGFPAGCETPEAKEEYAQELSRVNNLNIDVSEIQYSASKRLCAKLCLNSVWGKLGQRNYKKKTVYVTEVRDFYEIEADPNLDIENIHVVNENMLQITYSQLDKPSPSHVNCAIAALTTSMARHYVLDRFLYKIPNKNLLYLDTDGVLYKDHVIPRYLSCDIGLGEMQDEIVSKFGPGWSIARTVILSHKCYAYYLRDPDGNERKDLVVVKVKGFSLKLQANAESNDITFDRMAYILLEDNDVTLQLRQTDEFCKDLQSATILTRPRYKKFAFNYDRKRLIKSDDLTLVPWGF